MPRVYICPRCGYETDRIGNYRSHIAKQKRCKPKNSELIPTIDNVIIRKSSTSPQAPQQQSAAPTQAAQPLPPNISIAGSHDVNVNSHNTHNTNNHFHVTVNNVMPFRREDLSHITQKQWSSLAERMAKGDGHAAVLEMLSLVNYNPERPENMNMYFPPQDPGKDDRVLYLNCRTHTWKWVDRAQALQWLAEAKAEQVQDHVDNRRRIHVAEVREGVDAFVERARKDFAEDGTLVKAADAVVTCGSRIMLLMHRDLLEMEYARAGKSLCAQRGPQDQAAPEDGHDSD